MIEARVNSDGSVDEVVADCISSVHLEQLARDTWSLIMLDYSTGAELHVTITPKRGIIYESRGIAVICTDRTPETQEAGQK